MLTTITIAAIVIIIAVLFTIITVAVRKNVKTGDMFITNNLKVVKVIAESHCDHGIKRLDLIKCLIKSNLNGTIFKNTFTMSHIIGFDNCVETNKADNIFFTVRGNRKFVSRMVEKDPIETNKLTIIVCYENNEWLLATAFSGEIAPKEPWSDFDSVDEKTESINFWANHALCGTNENDSDDCLELYMNEKVPSVYRSEFIDYAANLCFEETDYSKQETDLYCEEFDNMDWVKSKEAAVNDIVDYDDIINHNKSITANTRRIMQNAFAESNCCIKMALDTIESNCILSPIYGIDKNANLVVIDHYHRVTPETIATNDSTKPNYNLSAREIFEKGDID